MLNQAIALTKKFFDNREAGKHSGCLWACYQLAPNNTNNNFVLKEKCLAKSSRLATPWKHGGNDMALT
jgi:hypothetical protein